MWLRSSVAVAPIPGNSICHSCRHKKTKRIKKRIKYLEINLLKEAKDLYSENKMPLKEIEDDTDGKIY